MELYNTLTKTRDEVTSTDGKMRMYVCGVTPYDTTHLGHGFTYVMFDTLARYMDYVGYETITVENVTDIDDDILRTAKERGVHWHQLATRETQKFLEDTAALNVRRTDHFPYATLETPKMQEMVQTLIDKGLAYERNGSVYYSVKADPDFGKLVDWGYDEMLKIANERGNMPDDPNKDDPLDFVLWQGSKPGEPMWDSPWGLGRPGWHIECSAMSMRYLGNTVDIHSGGEDLIFPHHEAEIAQSEGYSGEPFVRYWFHVAMVRLDGEKMSKSLGNMIFVRDLLRDYSGDAIRLYLLSHKYRDQWAADDAYEQLPHMMEISARWAEVIFVRSGSGKTLDASGYETRFKAALDDDFDTPTAVSVVGELADAIHTAADNGRDLKTAQSVFHTLAADVLGLRLADARPA